MLAFALQSSSPGATSPGATSLVLFAVLAAVAAWVAWRVVLHRQRASKAQSILHDDFTAFVLQALANAARLDGQVGAAERNAIAGALQELSGSPAEPARVDAALSAAPLGKEDLLAYLEDHSARLSHDQKVGFLRALLAVFVADGRFDESEHQALIEFTAAIGFDRQTAPGRLRGLLSDMARGRVIT